MKRFNDSIANRYCVYVHTFPNGKVYVGITCSKPNDRWKCGRGYINQPRVWRAICKYGWDNIRHDIVADGLAREVACEMEKYLIAFYDSTHHEKGYNSTFGGDHYEMTEEHKNKIGAANKGKPSPLRGVSFTDEHRRKISVANSGKKRTEEQRKKQSEYMRKNAIGGNNPRARKVCCVENGMVFSCVKDAAMWTGASRQSISDALNGRSSKSAGFCWKYLSNL